jgi:glutathione S-transferase
MTTAQSLVALVALLAAGLYLYMSIVVGQARVKFQIAAPATTGHPEFERTYRVQMNTLETLPVFLLCLFLFSFYVSEWLAALLGAVWIAGRYLYMQAYIKAAEGRSLGFGVQGAAVITLLVGAVLGVLWSLIT